MTTTPPAAQTPPFAWRRWVRAPVLAASAVLLVAEGPRRLAAVFAILAFAEVLELLPLAGYPRLQNWVRWLSAGLVVGTVGVYFVLSFRGR